MSWDVDGTLYELPAMVRSVFWSALRGMVSPPWPVATLRELGRLRRFRRAMDRVRDDGGALGDRMPPDRDELVAIETRWYGRAIARVGIRRGVGPLIDAFGARGLRQIVVSDYRADYKLRALGLDGAFEQVYAGEELGHLKPSPELFARVAEALGVEPSRILHIGDRDDRDRAAAEAAGCRVLVLEGAPPRPERLLTE